MVVVQLYTSSSLAENTTFESNSKISNHSFPNTITSLTMVESENIWLAKKLELTDNLRAGRAKMCSYLHAN